MLSGQFGNARLVVLACEVGGRWSDETRDFLRHLAKAKGRGEPFPVQRRAEAAWDLRWRVLMTCSAAKAFALSLLEARSCVSGDGCIPLTGEVTGDARYEPAGESVAGSDWWVVDGSSGDSGQERPGLY